MSVCFKWNWYTLIISFIWADSWPDDSQTLPTGDSWPDDSQTQTLQTDNSQTLPTIDSWPDNSQTQTLQTDDLQNLQTDDSWPANDLQTRQTGDPASYYQPSVDKGPLSKYVYYYGKLVLRLKRVFSLMIVFIIPEGSVTEWNLVTPFLRFWNLLNRRKLCIPLDILGFCI